MTFYHGSPLRALAELKPFLSEHGAPYIYFATDPLVALLYAVKPVPKPFSFYPYGFGKDGRVIYSEYFEDAFRALYRGRAGYLYACHDLKGLKKPTQISCAYTCSEPVRVDAVTEIPDLYVYFKEQEEKGRFLIKRRADVSDQEMRLVEASLQEDIDRHGLKALPEHAMSLFIRTHFPGVWARG